MQMSAVRFDDLPAQRKAESHTFRFRCVKWFEQMFSNFGRNATTVILNADGSNAILQIRPNGNNSFAIAARSCGIHGVGDQVEQHLFDLNRIGSNNEGREAFHPNPHALLRCFFRRQLGDL